MKRTFTTAVCAAFVGVLVLSQSALAQQKTAKQCNDEWTADKAAIQASGKTKRVFVAECRGVAAPATSPKSASVKSASVKSASAKSASAKPAAALPATGQFTTEAEAKASCPSDAVVWINPKSKIYHAGGSRSYGRTKQGAYMCEQESAAAGFRAPKTATRASI